MVQVLLCARLPIRVGHMNAGSLFEHLSVGRAYTAHLETWRVQQFTYLFDAFFRLGIQVGDLPFEAVKEFSSDDVVLGAVPEKMHRVALSTIALRVLAGTGVRVTCVDESVRWAYTARHDRLKSSPATCL